MRLRLATLATIAIAVGFVILIVASGAAIGDVATGTGIASWLVVLTVTAGAGAAFAAASQALLVIALVTLAVAGATLWVRNGRRRAALRTA